MFKNTKMAQNLPGDSIRHTLQSEKNRKKKSGIHNFQASRMIFHDKLKILYLSLLTLVPSPLRKCASV